jgi:PIN domain nuclease of toxin-antitoxin system
MSALVLDTHATVWSLLDRTKLSTAAKAAIEAATTNGLPVFVPTISVVEITYLIEKQKLPAVLKSQLLTALDDPNSNLTIAPLDLDVANRVEHVERNEVPDMPDRIIAATAVHLGLPLVSRDGKIWASAVSTIW